MDRAPFPGAYWVQERLLAGPYPRRSELAALVAAGVTLFLDLTEAGEEPPYEPDLPAGAQHLRRPIRDFGLPTPGELGEILRLLDSALMEGRTVYLHCRGGLGRTGTVTGCFLAHHGRTGEEALRALRRLRSACDGDSPETEAQCALVRQWSEQLSPGGR